MRLTNSQTFELIKMANISSSEDFKKKLQKLEDQENKARDQIAKRRQILIAEENKRLEDEKERQQAAEVIRKQEELERVEVIRMQQEQERKQKEQERLEVIRKEKETERLEAIRVHNEAQLKIQIQQEALRQNEIELKRQKDLAVQQIRSKLEDRIQQSQVQERRPVEEDTLVFEEQRVEADQEILCTPPFEDHGQKSEAENQKKRKSIEPVENITVSQPQKKLDEEDRGKKKRKSIEPVENITVLERQNKSDEVTEDQRKKAGTPLLDEVTDESGEKVDEETIPEGRGKRRAKKRKSTEHVPHKGKDMLALAAACFPESDEAVVLPELSFFTNNDGIFGDVQSQEIIQYLSVDTTQDQFPVPPAVQDNEVPPAHVPETGEELLSRFINLLESRLILQHVELSKSSKGKTKNPTIPSFINNEWSEYIKTTSNRSKDIISKFNQLQATLVQTYNFVGSQLGIITEKQAFIESKLVDIFHILRSSNIRSREPERKRPR